MASFPTIELPGVDPRVLDFAERLFAEHWEPAYGAEDVARLAVRAFEAATAFFAAVDAPVEVRVASDWHIGDVAGDGV